MNQAVVIGAGAGGMMSARVLARYFNNVIILEKGSLPQKPEPRKTVPQGEHVHALLGAGHDFFEEYFPGLLREMQEEGANLIDSSHDICWFFQGSWRPRCKSGLPLLLSLRPHLDWHMRRRLLADCNNVSIRENCSVESFLSGEDQTRITGVAYLDGRGKSQELEADLVVDCSGRHSQTPEWLESLGFSSPREKRLQMELAYTSRIYKKPENFQEDWKLLLIYPRIPTHWKAGFISTVQDNCWIVSMFGYFGDHAPVDDEGFLGFTETLLKPDIYHFLKDLKPVSETKRYKLPAIRRRYYEKLSRFPDGLVVIGDANCVFNPIFGQGIAAISLYARNLNHYLDLYQKRGRSDLKGFSRMYQKSLSAALDLPWFITNMLDLSYPRAKGFRPPGMRLITWILTRTLEAVSGNPALNQTFLQVLHLHKGLGALLNPAFTIPVILHGIKAFFVPLEKRANTGERPV